MKFSFKKAVNRIVKDVKSPMAKVLNPVGAITAGMGLDKLSGSSGGSGGSGGNVGANSVEKTLSSAEYGKYKQDFFNSLGGSSTLADRANQASQASINAKKYGAAGTQRLSAAQEGEMQRKGAVDQAMALGEQDVSRKGAALNALMSEASIRSGADIAQSQIALANQKPKQGLLSEMLGGLI